MPKPIRNQKMVGGSMNGSLKVFQTVVLLIFVVLFFTSCGGSQTTLSSGAASGTTTGGGGNNTGQSSGTQTIEEEEASATIPAGYIATELFATVPETVDYLNLTTVDQVYSQRCKFTNGSVINDLTCTVQANELSLFYDGIKFQYNVPANQCNYIGTYPYWYYNYEIGTGPTDVIVNVNKDASGTVTSTSCSVDGSALASCSTATPPASWNDVEFDIAEEINVKCKYDTSDQDGGANCCLGKYRLRTNIVTPEGSSPTDERGKLWGGNIESCIGGAGKTDWDKKTAAGYPVYNIEKMMPNVPRTKIMRISAPINKITSRSNISLANYFTTGIHTHTGYGSASGVTTSQLPYFVDPISDRSGSPVVAGSPHYIFDCLDEAFETNYRIRMMVQEWDTVAALQTYITTGVSGPTTADEPGTAPADCPGLSGDPCNQAQDNDDFVREIPWTSYINTFPASRTLYFPKHTYQEL